MFNLINAAASVLGQFKRREEGVALTEYVVLLALLVGGVIVAVIAFGDSLGDVWALWAGWLSGQETAVASLSGNPGAVTTTD